MAARGCGRLRGRGRPREEGHPRLRGSSSLARLYTNQTKQRDAVRLDEDLEVPNQPTPPNPPTQVDHPQRTKGPNRGIPVPSDPSTRQRLLIRLGG